MSSLYTRIKLTLGRSDPDAHALAALQSDEGVRVEHGPTIGLLPENPNGCGIIFYPGGRCDVRAYAPVLKPLAANGYSVYMCQMPLRLAVLDANRAQRVIDSNPEVRDWIIGGHSMGGAMVAAYHFKHPDVARGMFFLASYPANMHAIPDSSLPVAMLYGTADTITRKREFEASYGRLPPHADFIAIEGGDHYQFGSFEDVPVTATITREEQQRQTVAALRNWCQTLGAGV